MNAIRNLLVATVGLFFISGCATVNKMPSDDSKTALDVAEKSVLTGSISVQNLNKIKHQPTLVAILVEKDGKTLSFTEPTLLEDKGADGREYIYSIDVPPGEATLKLARFSRQVPMLLRAVAELQFETAIDVPADSLVYLGHIDAQIVPRMNDEQPRAGSVVPLIDQAVAGFSNGTFKVAITDQSEKDLAVLRSRFPYLAQQEISVSILQIASE